MKKIAKLGLLLLALVSINISMSAQNFGYLNSQVILSKMPEVKQMEANLEALQKQLQKQGEQMVANFKKQEQAAMQKQEKGELSPIQQQTLGAELQKEQQKILDFEKDMQKQLVEKRDALLKPILDKVNTAIKDVATEGKFQYIFDQGAGAILYADPGQDVTQKVSTKLGL
ncbi:MAG: OmpH family outer membrane protein [Saprospiraceae bacterium]